MGEERAIASERLMQTVGVAWPGRVDLGEERAIASERLMQQQTVAARPRACEVKNVLSRLSV